jgi:hypothetical protein
VAGALDALVRATRAGQADLLRFAGRLLAAWREAGQLVLELHPDGITVDGASVWRAADSQHRWFLPAFMAGLRAIALEPEATEEALLDLGEQLAMASARTDTIERLRDWAWAGASDGLVLRLEASFVEVLETGESARAVSSGELDILRGAIMIGADGAQVAIERADLERAVRQPELDEPIAAFAEMAASHLLDLDGATFKALAAETKDPVAWALAEVRAIAELPVLRTGHALRRAARTIARLCEEGCSSERVLPLVRDLLRSASDEASLGAELVRCGIGPSLGRGLDPDAASVEVLIEICAQAPDVRKPFALALLARAADIRVARLMTTLVLRLGVQGLLAPAEVPAEAAGLNAWVRALVDAHGVGALDTWISEGQPAISVAIILSAPEQQLERLLPRVRSIALQAGGEVAAGVAAKVPLGGAEGRAVVLELLKASSGWSTAARYVAVQRLLDGGYVSDVAGLVRDRRADLGARRAALAVLEAAPAAWRTVIAWRVAELLDTPEMVGPLREARKRARAAS